MEIVHLIIAAAPERQIVVAAARRDTDEGLGHEAGDNVELARHLGANLAVGGQPVGGAERIVEHKIKLKLARRVFMIALDHVEAHRLTVFNHAHEDRS